MNANWLDRRLQLAILATIVLVTPVVYVELRTPPEPTPPSVPVVYDCRPPASGMRRIGDPKSILFDVPAAEFNVQGGGTEDMPPFRTGFAVTVGSGPAMLRVEFPHSSEASPMPKPERTFSVRAEKRDVRYGPGEVIGEDDWGYLETGERWREVRFSPGDMVARYGFTSPQDARRLDEVISSACLNRH